MSKLQEIPHLETCRRSFSCNLFLQGQGIVIFFQTQPCFSKNNKKRKIISFTENHDSNQDLPFQNYFSRLFFSRKAIRVEI